MYHMFAAPFPTLPVPLPGCPSSHHVVSHDVTSCHVASCPVLPCDIMTAAFRGMWQRRPCMQAYMHAYRQACRQCRHAGSQAARQPGSQAARQPGSQAARQPGSQALDNTRKHASARARTHLGVCCGSHTMLTCQPRFPFAMHFVSTIKPKAIWDIRCMSSVRESSASRGRHGIL